MRREAQALMDRLGERDRPGQPLEELSLAQRQMVGIARALSRQSRLLIMDEPTASLSARETQTLFRIIRQLQSEGVAILYISHRLEEVFALADRVTVLRDGRLVETRAIADVSRDELVRLMVGRELLEPKNGARATGTAAGDVLLDVRGLTRAGAVPGYLVLRACGGDRRAGRTGRRGPLRSRHDDLRDRHGRRAAR